MQESIVIQDKQICIGNMFYGTNSAESRGICGYGELLSVRVIKVEEQPYIGLYSEHSHKGWGNLEGVVPSHHGYWQSAEGLFKYFELVSSDRLIAGNFFFKKKSLSGMKCKVLYEDRRNNQCFVEFDKNIGGGCCDGLGKTGHCIAVPSVFLSDVEEKAPPKFKSKRKGGVLDLDEKEKKDIFSPIQEIVSEVTLSNSNFALEWSSKAPEDTWHVTKIGHPAEVNEFESADTDFARIFEAETAAQSLEKKWERILPLKATLSESPTISDEEIDFFGEEKKDPFNGDWTYYEQVVEHKLE